MPALFLMAIGLAGGQQEAAQTVDLVRLRWSFNNGQILRYHVREEQTILDRAEGAQAIRILVDSQFKLQVLQSDGESAKLHCTIEKLVRTMATGEDRIVLDAATPYQRRESKEVGLLRQMAAQPLIAIISSDGVIGPINAEVRQRNVSDEAIVAGVGHVRRALATLSSWIPKEPVGVGSAWSREEQLPAGVANLTRRNQLSFREMSNGACLVDCWIKISSDPPNSHSNLMATVTMAKPGHATILFDLERGLVKQVNSRIRFDMDMKSRAADGTDVASFQSLAASTRMELIEQQPAVRGN